MTRAAPRRWLAGVILCALATPSASWGACNVSATIVPFGAYNPASAAAKDGTGTVTVTCTVLVALGLSWTILLSSGGSGTYTSRQLNNGTATLNYNLYTTTGRTTIWGDGTGGTATVSDSVLLAIGTTNFSYTMYGRIPALQDAKAGAYTDSIVATINY